MLVTKSSEEANTKLDDWKAVSESNGVCISCTKTEYLRCNFCGKEQDDSQAVTIGGDSVASKTKFKYLGFVI